MVFPTHPVVNRSMSHRVLRANKGSPSMPPRRASLMSFPRDKGGLTRFVETSMPDNTSSQKNNLGERLTVIISRC